MKDDVFSKKTLRMLEDNEFAVKKIGSFITFKKVYDANAMLLIPAFFLTLIAVVHIQQHPFKTLFAIIFIALITKGLWIRLTRKLHFQIDFSDSTFKFCDRKRNIHWHFLKDVEEVLWRSRLIGEHTSDFKSTSKEHEISLMVRLNNNHILPLFKFQSDFAEPTSEIMEIYHFLENSVKEITVI